MPEVVRRIISPEPWVIRMLIERKPILYRPFRLVYLTFLEEVMKDLRDRTSWALTVSGTARSVIVSRLLELIAPK